MVALLLAHGADVNWATTKGGCTPLHVAVQHGNMDIFTMLVEHGAGIDSPDGKGWTPLHHACVEGRRAMAPTSAEDEARGRAMSSSHIASDTL
jgi:ankyrin repeat protein